MGIGTGALIAGLFGMNVSSDFSACFTLSSPGISLQATWKHTHTPLRGCPSPPYSLRFSLRGPGSEGAFDYPPVDPAF